jgi:hypothetical protein
MRKIKTLVLIGFSAIILTVFLGFVKPKLVKTKVNDRITVLIPKGWLAMEGMDFIQRYPSVRAPVAAYTNEERNIDFSVNISATRWAEADLELAKSFFKASLFNTFDKVEIIKEGIQTLGKKKLIFFEFDSRMEGNRRKEGQQEAIMRYTYIQYYVEKDRTLVFSFNCPARYKEEWQETARDMMKAIKIK